MKNTSSSIWRTSSKAAFSSGWASSLYCAGLAVLQISAEPGIWRLQLNLLLKNGRSQGPWKGWGSSHVCIWDHQCFPWALIHLGEAQVPQDFEHIAISLFFYRWRLSEWLPLRTIHVLILMLPECGIMVKSKSIADVMTRKPAAPDPQFHEPQKENSWAGYSINPAPPIILFLLGLILRGTTRRAWNLRWCTKLVTSCSRQFPRFFRIWPWSSLIISSQEHRLKSA